jgi:quercetin dioxygenase-like cupin family protein
MQNIGSCMRCRVDDLQPNLRLVAEKSRFGCLLAVARAGAAALAGRLRMPTVSGFSMFASIPEEQITDKISRRIVSGEKGMIVWWSIAAGVHVESHHHTNEQIVWMLKGKMEFRLGDEQRICGPGDIVVIPGGVEHEGWFHEDTEVIDFFAPPRDDFLLGGKPPYMGES